jgi:hypothetical protein
MAAQAMRTQALGLAATPRRVRLPAVPGKLPMTARAAQATIRLREPAQLRAMLARVRAAQAQGQPLAKAARARLQV